MNINEDDVFNFFVKNANAIIVFGVILIFFIFGYFNSISYKKTMAIHNLQDKDYEEAIHYLKDVAENSSEESERDKYAQITIETYFRLGKEYDAISFARTTKSESPFIYYILGIKDIENGDTASALYHLYHASDRYPEPYNTLKNSIQDKSIDLVKDFIIPDSIIDVVPVSKILKGGKVFKGARNIARFNPQKAKEYGQLPKHMADKKFKEYEECLVKNSNNESKCNNILNIYE